MDFGSRQFARLFTVATLMASATFAIGNIIQLVSSWYLGADAFAAMAAVYPYRLIPDIVVALFAEGAAAASSVAMGRGDREAACRTFSQGLYVMLALGTVFTLGFHAFETPYLNLLGITGEVRSQALAFGNGFVFSILSGMLQDYLRVQVYADGGERYCLLGSIAYLIVHSVTALAFVSRWGAEGLGWSVACATFAYVAVLSLHFCRRAALRLRLSFSPSTLLHTVALGLGSLVPQLSLIAISFVTARIAASRFGAVGLAVVSAVNGTGALINFLQAVGVVILPLAAVYFGEANRTGLRRTMRRATVYLLVEGVVLSLPLLLFPSQVARLFGITEPATLKAMSEAMLWLGAFLLPAGFAALGGTYLQATGRVRLASAYVLCRSVIFPAAAILLGIEFCGTSGLAAATAGETIFLAVAILLGSAIARWRGLEFPLLIPPERGNEFVLDTEVNGEGAATSAQVVRTLLIGRLAPRDRRTLWAAMAVEELLMVIHDANPGRRVRAEITLDFPEPDTLRLIIRDDGRLFDATSPDTGGDSLSFFILSRLTRKSDRSGMTVTGSNRSLLLFKQEPQKS